MQCRVLLGDNVMSNKMHSSLITESREKALEQILKMLRCSDEQSLLNTKCGEYHSLNKTFVRWLGRWQNIASEFRIQKSDSDYQEATGNVCFVSCISSNYECRLAGFTSLSSALAWAGLRLSNTAGEKDAFRARWQHLLSGVNQ